MPRRPADTSQPAAVWILYCVFCNCTGWALSAIHQLNLMGYGMAFVLGAIGFVIWQRKVRADGWGAFKPHKLKRRFRRPFAAAFLVLAALALLGGVIHAPNNYDGLAYRTPRVLNWLAEQRWHWIHTDFVRLNTRTCGFEWVTAPLIVFTNTDRLVFLINAVSILLLPGLTFSLFRRVGVKGRTAWHWMWILPTAYGYLLQAGSIVNDMFGAVFAVAAVDFALRARKSGRTGEAIISVLAAAMLTAAKASNLPLLLPWLVAFLWAWRSWLPKPVALAAVILPAVGASFLPTAVLNQHYGGDWTGAKIEHVALGVGPAWVHFFNNGVNYLIQNLAPPFFPMASAWNHLADQVTPPALTHLMEKYIETGAAHFQLWEMQSEEEAGLGFGVTTLLLLSVAAGWWGRRRAGVGGGREEGMLRCVRYAPWVSLFYTMCKMGLSGGARYLAPYHPLLMMGLLVGESQARLMSKKWWRVWAHTGFALALVLMVVTQSRPLWPAEWFFAKYGDHFESSAAGRRLVTVYDVYGKRANAFAPVVAALPEDATRLGFITADDPETSLWRPFGSRRILHVVTGETGDELRKRDIQYVLVKMMELREPWDAWMRRMDGRVLAAFTLRLRAGDPPSEWRLVELGWSDADVPSPYTPTNVPEGPMPK